jgi:hypothetical protein
MRSISGLRSIPSARTASGPSSSIIRPVPVPISTSRPIGRPASIATMARSTSHSATWSDRIASHSAA